VLQNRQRDERALRRTQGQHRQERRQEIIRRMRDEVLSPTRSFRTLVNIHGTDSTMEFIIDGKPIDYAFHLTQQLLSVKNLQEGGMNCMQLKFDDDCVDVTNYHLLARGDECPPLTHDEFFKVAEVLAFMYGTPLKVKADHSYKVINGFTVPSSIVSVSKTPARTFYGKFGLVSATNQSGLDIAGMTFGDEARDLLRTLSEYLDEEGELRESLKENIHQLDARIQEVLVANRRYDVDGAATKFPPIYRYSLESAQRDGSWAPFPLNRRYYNNGDVPRRLRVIANRLGGAAAAEGGTRRRRSKRTKKRNRSKRSLLIQVE